MKWPRRTPNEYGAMARVLVPEDRSPQTACVARTPDGRDTNVYAVLPCAPSQDTRTAYGRDTVGERLPDARDTDQTIVQVDDQENVLQTMLDVLRTALSTANERAERAEKRAETAERRIDELHAALGAKDEEKRQLTTLLADESAEHRRVVALLLDRIPERRSWWPWRRR